MPITAILEKNAKLYPDDISLVEVNPKSKSEGGPLCGAYSFADPDRGAERNEITWKEFDERANRFANLLISKGIKKGDKVAILLMNCLEWLPIYFGTLKAGALAVPLNFRFTAEEICHCLNIAECKALVFGPEFVERVESVKGDLPCLKLNFYLCDGTPPKFAESYNRLAAASSPENPCVELSDGDDAAIYFSSGTTGMPKAILHIHKTLMFACEVEQNHHGQTKEDIFLCIPPLYHTGAKMHWFGSLLTGGRGVILKGTDPDLILRTISNEGCTIVWLLVPWVQDILDMLDRGGIKLSEYSLSQLRLMHIGAQPVPPSLVKRWLEYFPGQQYDTNYGLSESIGPGCVHLGVENIENVGSIGKAGYGWQVKIVDTDLKEVNPGEVGELAVKGDGVMKFYYKNPEATCEVLKDGWLLTGDMARADGDGFIYLVDRKKDVIISGGENIYPVQIENFIRTNSAVKDAAVIGIPDKRLGEIAAAVIEVKEGCVLTDDEVNRFCMELPRYKRPRKIIFDKVPRNPTGKIEKPKLRGIYSGFAENSPGMC